LLAKILKRGGNVLILDEPTNDLDLGTLRLLEEALVAFGGNVIVVSHDRYFLNRVCTAILAFEGGGVVRYHVGNYDYYLEKSESCRASASLADRKTAGDAPALQSKSPKPRKLKWKEERELEGMEAAILAAESEVARIEAVFAAPDFYTSHAADFSRSEAELRQARDLVARLYARWAELGEVAAALEK
jgi:ABC-type sulfate/molybdate transport systems ATPase subunit